MDEFFAPKQKMYGTAESPLHTVTNVKKKVGVLFFLIFCSLSQAKNSSFFCRGNLFFSLCFFIFIRTLGSNELNLKKIWKIRRAKNLFKNRKNFLELHPLKGAKKLLLKRHQKTSVERKKTFLKKKPQNSSFK